MRVFAAFALLFVIAAGAFLYSRTLPHWKDEGAFRAGYAELQSRYEADTIEHLAASEAYNNLFEKYVSPRNALKKYSLTAMALAATGMLLFCRGIRGLRPPRSKWALIPVAMAGTVVSVWGSLADIDEAFGRGDVPYWSNLDKGFIGVLFMYPVIALFFTGLNMVAIWQKVPDPGRPIFPVNGARARPIVSASLALTITYTALMAWDGGSYFALIATPFWLYFYLSVLAISADGRRSMVPGR